jgi:hypothetical protein
LRLPPPISQEYPNPNPFQRLVSTPSPPPPHVTLSPCLLSTTYVSPGKGVTLQLCSAPPVVLTPYPCHAGGYKLRTTLEGKRLCLPTGDAMLFSVLPFRQTLCVLGAYCTSMVLYEAPLGRWDCNIGKGSSCSSVSSLLCPVHRAGEYCFYFRRCPQRETGANTASSHLTPPSFVSKSLIPPWQCIPVLKLALLNKGQGVR